MKNFYVLIDNQRFPGRASSKSLTANTIEIYRSAQCQGCELYCKIEEELILGLRRFPSLRPLTHSPDKRSKMGLSNCPFKEY